MRIGPASIRLPAPTIRLRLTALYGLVFLVTGAVLLTIGYELVRHNLNAPSDYRNELRKLGIVPPAFGRPPGFVPGSAGARIAVLGDRELAVLACLVGGMERRDIARHLGIAENTVRTHIYRIYRKLSVHSRGEAVFEAQKLGLLDF